MGKVLAFNTDRCTGCGLCELICSLVHTETCNPARSKFRSQGWKRKGSIFKRFVDIVKMPHVLPLARFPP